jgi:hypothetical protein
MCEDEFYICGMKTLIVIWLVIGALLYLGVLKVDVTIEKFDDDAEPQD